MELLLLFDNNIVDFSKVLENSLVGGLLVAFAATFVKPVLNSLISSNEQNTKSNADSAVALSQMTANQGQANTTIINNQADAAKQAAQYHQDNLERNMRLDSDLKELRSEIGQKLLQILDAVSSG
jgi:hypothetical protein